MSLHRSQRAVRNLGLGSSRLARPPAVLEEPDIKPIPAPVVLEVVALGTGEVFGAGQPHGNSVTVGGVDPDGYNIAYVTATLGTAGSGAPIVPAGWTQTMAVTGIDVGAYDDNLYVVEADAPGTTDVTFTFSPEVLDGGVWVVSATPGATVHQRDSANLSGGSSSSFTEDFDPTTSPSIIVMCVLRNAPGLPTVTPGGIGSDSPATPGQWHFVAGRVGLETVLQHLDDPPSTTVDEGPGWIALGWVMHEIGL